MAAGPTITLIIAQFCRSIAVLCDRSIDAQDQCGRPANKWRNIGGARPVEKGGRHPLD
jgi:hypothetical protein